MLPDVCWDVVPEGSTYQADTPASTGCGSKVRSVHPEVQIRHGGKHLEGLEAFLLFYILVQVLKKILATSHWFYCLAIILFSNLSLGKTQGPKL